MIVIMVLVGWVIVSIPTTLILGALARRSACVRLELAPVVARPQVPLALVGRSRASGMPAGRVRTASLLSHR